MPAPAETRWRRPGLRRCIRATPTCSASDAAAEWLCLLEAFEQPHRSGLVRAASCTSFFGFTTDDLAIEGDALTDRVANALREWADHARQRGMAAVFEAAQLAGMGRRVLSQQGGERHMTDLAHIGQLLHEMSHRERLTLPALRDWLRRQCDERKGGDVERNRRLDSDAAAVQIMTVFVSKGLQFPIVYLPFVFNRFVRTDDILLYHDENDIRCLHIGGKKSPDRKAVEQLNCDEAARERHPADVCGVDAGAVAGGGVVGAHEGRGERRAVAAAAGPPGRRRQRAGPL